MKHTKIKYIEMQLDQEANAAWLALCLKKLVHSQKIATVGRYKMINCMQNLICRFDNRTDLIPISCYKPNMTEDPKIATMLPARVHLII